MMEKYLEKLGLILYDILPDKITKNDNVRQDLGTLSPAENIQTLQREYCIKKLSLCVIALIAGVFLSVVLWIGNVNDTKIVDNELVRNEYGEGQNDYTFKVTDGEVEYDITLELSERKYNESELNTLSNELIGILDSKILGKNESLDKVEYDLNFVSSVSGYPFSIEYETDRNYISSEGELLNLKLKEPVVTQIDMTLTYDKFIVTHTLFVKVCTKAIQPTVEELIQERINIDESENREKKEFVLPDRIGNITLSWSYERSYTGLICLIATPILVALIFVSKDKDLHKRVEERELQMRLDYPEIVSSLALLVGAGMTVPNAWKKIAYDYKNNKGEKGETKYAYEEMLITVYEMDSGVMQSIAYERFGRRCRIPCYNKFSTIVAQNIKKGASNLPLLLKDEAREAFEDRKHLARKQGEQAGTKLLAPMMLMLVITMVIIMVPALRTYF